MELNKKKGLYLLIFSVLYLIFTALVMKHGFHFANVSITIAVLLFGIYYYFKK